MEKETVQNNKERWIWKRTGSYRVFELFKKGKSISEISQEVGWRESTIENFIFCPLFLRKLERHLKGTFLEFQKNRILALAEIFKLLWDVVMGRKTVEGISPATACRHLISLLKIQEQPKIIMNISKTPEPEELKDLAEIFGFKDLEISEEEKSEADSQLDNRRDI